MKKSLAARLGPCFDATPINAKSFLICSSFLHPQKGIYYLAYGAKLVCDDADGNLRLVSEPWWCGMWPPSTELHSQLTAVERVTVTLSTLISPLPPNGWQRSWLLWSGTGMSGSQLVTCSRHLLKCQLHIPQQSLIDTAVFLFVQPCLVVPQAGATKQPKYIVIWRDIVDSSQWCVIGTTSVRRLR